MGSGSIRNFAKGRSEISPRRWNIGFRKFSALVALRSATRLLLSLLSSLQISKNGERGKGKESKITRRQRRLAKWAHMPRKNSSRSFEGHHSFHTPTQLDEPYKMMPVLLGYLSSFVSRLLVGPKKKVQNLKF